ncbi:MAG TPA: adenosyl-hopene transferase HpnH [Casimicrobiaceae bacterium]|nr:adenosyl-hopene transferase HpnH [Casimicrobiaceae bacterium]
MAVPLRQQLKIAGYIVAKKLRGEKRYPLVLMLEPLFQCNLACAGCGKIDYEDSVLRRRLSVEECLAAVDECGAPVVSIPGGEPLVHADIAAIVAGIVARRRFVYLCTNALLLEKKLHLFEPSVYLTFSVHLDGLRERHDESVCREGVFDIAIAAIRAAKRRGFRVNVNTTLFAGEDPRGVARFFDFASEELGVDGVTVSPGYSYEHAPRQDVFLGRRQAKQLFRDVFRERRGARWPLVHSSLFLDFICGNQDYRCTPWSNPTRNVFGWQRPCYLLVDEGYAESFAELMRTTRWDDYGTGRNRKCDNCMAHCGYEGTAVEDAFRHPWKALLASLRGPRTDGDMVPEPEIHYRDGDRVVIPVVARDRRG